MLHNAGNGELSLRESALFVSDKRRYPIFWHRAKGLYVIKALSKVDCHFNIILVLLHLFALSVTCVTVR